MVARVNWKKFIENKDSEYGRSRENYDKMVRELLDSGIFSFEPEGNYQLEGCGVIVSPRASGLWRPILYFTRKKDAEKYAEIEYANAQYEVTINKIEKEFNPQRK